MATIPRASDRDAGPLPFKVQALLKAKRARRKGGDIPRQVEGRLEGPLFKHALSQHYALTISYLLTLPWSEIDALIKTLPKNERRKVYEVVEKKSGLIW